MAPPPAALLLLADGRFPAGGHVHSAGIEAAVGEGRVADVDSLRAFLIGRLHTSGLADAALAAASAGRLGASDGELLAELVRRLDAECAARQSVPVLRAARAGWESVCGWPPLLDAHGPRRLTPAPSGGANHPCPRRGTVAAGPSRTTTPPSRPTTCSRRRPRPRCGDRPRPVRVVALPRRLGPFADRSRPGHGCRRGSLATLPRPGPMVEMAPSTRHWRAHSPLSGRPVPNETRELHGFNTITGNPCPRRPPTPARARPSGRIAVRRQRQDRAGLRLAAVTVTCRSRW